MGVINLLQGQIENTYVVDGSGPRLLLLVQFLGDLLVLRVLKIRAEELQVPLLQGSILVGLHFET